MSAAPQTSLEAQLRERIAADGPITFERYMAACLGAANDGYYLTRDPFGEAGDFVTAPEISGLFGEMCGLYLAHMFEIAGKPSGAAVAELGPGRGTLMRDMRHAWASLMPELAGAPVHLLETSPLLRAAQKEVIGSDAALAWHEKVTGLTAAVAGPIFGIANEFFDALPAAQYIWRDGSWHHRLVGLRDDRFGFITGGQVPDDPAFPEAPRDGMVAELCPQADDVMASLASAVAARGGAVLVIDYGRDGNPGDSIQAVAAHQAVDLFHEPGQADLSHWVDFAALRRTAEAAGARLIGPVPQGRFLMQIGLAMRAEQAGASAAPEERRALLAAIDRLTSPAQMGEVFKVAILVPPGEGLPPGFSGTED